MVSQVLVAAEAVLHVVTDPPGANVTLAGQAIGETPLTREFPAAKSVPLVIAKSGFQPIARRIELVQGKTLEFNETLRVEEKFGRVSISLQPQPR